MDRRVVWLAAAAVSCASVDEPLPPLASDATDRAAAGGDAEGPDGCDRAACDDGDPCTVTGCAAGVCVTEPLTGAPCEDGDPCTAGDTCTAGTCDGDAIDCDDGQPCTEDTCVATGCHWAPRAGPCDDGDDCTTDDGCAAGLCVGQELECSDENPCTIDLCVSPTGCTHTAAPGPCDDGDACTTEDNCDTSGACGGQPVECDDDGNQCTGDLQSGHWLSPDRAEWAPLRRRGRVHPGGGVRCRHVCRGATGLSGGPHMRGQRLRSRNRLLACP